MTEDYFSAIASCQLCDGSGYTGSGICECLLNHRIRVFMTYGGFSSKIIDFVFDPNYTVPYIESGEDYLTKYSHMPEKILEGGLSLYIFSQDAGRGKTVLSHYVIMQMCRHFAHTENYRPRLTFAFQSAEDFLTNALSYKDDEVWKSSVYVLDDLGNENRATKQRRDAMAPALQRAFQFRRNEGLPTIITSNYTPEALGSLYEGRVDSLLEIGVDGVIHGNLFRQVEVGGGEDLRTLTSAWDD